MLKTNCYECKNRRTIPGDAHSSCSMPDRNIKAREHGIKSGWFMYPYNFDPVWRINECNNFEANEERKAPRTEEK